MSVSDRVRAVITPQDGEGNASGDNIQLTYQYPYVDTRQESRTTEHQPIGEDPVVQHLGPGAREITVKGSCYLDEANDIDALPTGGRIGFQSHRWSGDAIVRRAETMTTGEGGGRRPGVENRVFEFRLELTEITGENPLFDGTTFSGNN